MTLNPSSPEMFFSRVFNSPHFFSEQKCSCVFFLFLVRIWWRRKLCIYDRIVCYEYENMEITSFKIRLYSIQNAVYGFMFLHYELKRIIV